jgi:hypothetical protein
VICRREDPHPGAQLSFTDLDGHRFQCFMTDRACPDIVGLEARHRAHARVEDRIREAKDTGLSNLPFREFMPNAVWLALVLVAQDLGAWSQKLLIDDPELQRAEPKRMRYALWHVAGRLVRSGRRVFCGSPAPGRGQRCSPVASAACGRCRCAPDPSAHRFFLAPFIPPSRGDVGTL